MQEQRARPDGPDFGPVAGRVQGIIPEEAGVYPSCVIFGQIGGKNGKTPVPTGGLGGGWVGNLQPETMAQDGASVNHRYRFDHNRAGRLNRGVHSHWSTMKKLGKDTSYSFIQPRRRRMPTAGQRRTQSKGQP